MTGKRTAGFPATLALAAALAACSSAPAPSGISLSTDFEGGCLARVERISEGQFRAAVPGQADHDGRNRQASWYYFRVDGARGREVTVVLNDLKGEYNFAPAPACVRADTPPFVSSDGITWRPLDQIAVEHDQARLQFKPDSDAFWVAHLEPYTASRLDRFLAEVRTLVKGNAYCEDRIIGKSVEGRDLHLLEIGEISGKLPVPQPCVWLMCRQHAWETGTSFVGEGAIRFLLSDAGRPVRRSCTFKIFPMMDPDGCADGGIRFNRNGYDVNRNWDTADPDDPESRKLMPEICAAKAQMNRWPGLFVTLHNQETGEWLSSSGRNRDIAGRFWKALSEKTSFSPSEPGPRAPAAVPAPGRASVYEFQDGKSGMTAFLLEQGITRSPKLGRQATSQDRREFGAQLIQVMAQVALEGR